MSVRVRDGRAADFDAALTVFVKSNRARRCGVWPHQATSVERFEACLHRRDSWLLVAEIGSTTVGMAVAEPMRDDDGTGAVVPDECFLGYLYVLPERWGQGIGGALLDAVLAEARQRGCRRISLWTHDDNERSHRLYGGRGFSPTGRHSGGQGEWERLIS